MSTASIVIRCDASRTIGSGHLIRCRNLARGLRRRGAAVHFLCRAHADALHRLLLAGEFPILELPLRPMAAAAPADARADQPYASWLGCSQEQDAADCLATLADAGLRPGIVVVDHYGLSALWEQRLRQGAGEPRLLVIDDLADRSHAADWLLDANRLPGGEDVEPLRRLTGGGDLLLGPAHALLGPEYPILQPLLPVRRQLRRLLVFFGGVDEANLTAVAVHALLHPALAGLAVDVVLGAGAPHREAVARLLGDQSRMELHIGLPSLAGLMARADLAIGAAGTTSWERACLGLPALVVPVADNQRAGAIALERSGAGRCLPLLGAEDAAERLRRAVQELAACPQALEAMSRACLQLGDGRGLARAVATLLGPSPGLRLRVSGPADLWLYHWWANDPEVRRGSFTPRMIPLAEHRDWFLARLSSPLALLRVLEDGEGLPLGQIRFERSAGNEHQDAKPLGVNPRDLNHRAVISFSLDRLARGRGLAAALLELGITEVARCWGPALEVVGEVKTGNEPSCRAFLRAGFQEAPARRQGVRCFLRTAG